MQAMLQPPGTAAEPDFRLACGLPDLIAAKVSILTRNSG